jgi:spermidine dehydrogenase
MEAEMRDVLQRALGAHGFDAGRDIEAITINRWSHGYSYEYMRPWDAFWPAGKLPITTARSGWGHIAVANADAGAFAYVQGAIDQATRAVGELLPGARMPKWSTFPGPPVKKLGVA